MLWEVKVSGGNGSLIVGVGFEDGLSVNTSIEDVVVLSSDERSGSSGHKLMLELVYRGVKSLTRPGWNRGGIQGISQEDLATDAGIERAYMGSIERGERNPTYDKLLSIADALDISLPELVDV